MRTVLLSLTLLAGTALPSVASETHAPIILAQSGNVDYRVSVLEEQIRQLNGRIEELNFQLLEMQERLRRQQEDNDFRLQQIEERQGNLDAGRTEDTASVDEDGFIRLEKPEPSASEQTAVDTDGAIETETATRTIDGVEIYDGESGVDTNTGGTLGSIQFDANGNIIDSTIGEPHDLTAGLGQNIASPLPTDPDQLFQLGYDHVQTGRYQDAETALVAFSNQHATHPRLPEARFWLGESYLGRGDFRMAADVYLDVHERWPNGKFGPQSLLKLGVSVAGLNQRELACATFAEVLKKYPDASRVVRRAVAFEQRAAQCAIN
ncbi:MAG: tol-pal system protein YbgF [Rhizobiaceae bacterium]|nr:tol-pal system protein YbgF [Rhizobiaceae bacterium]